MNVIENDFGTEAFGMFLKALHQLRPLHAVCVGRPVVNLGGDGELSALLEASYEHRFQVGACSVYSSGVTSGAGAEDQEGAVACV